MEKLLIARDRQEFQAADVNSMQAYMDEAMAHVVMDAITTEKMFVGLEVAQKSPTEITVASGRLWDGVTGKRYAKSEAGDISLYSYLPVSDKRYLDISVIGQETSMDQEPRDYLVDLVAQTTEPKSVYMTTSREVLIQITAGLESSQPQKPAPPTGYTTIAQVLLTTSGIATIVVADNKKLMRLFEVYQAGVEHGEWIALMTPRISTLFSDLATLASRVSGIVDQTLVRTLAADLALVKQKLSLPASYAAYEADDFVTFDKSDTANTEYRARVYQGLRFPYEGEREQQLNLYNPYESTVKNFSGFVLPAHTEVTRLRTTGLTGTLLISQYPSYQPVEAKLMTRTRVRLTMQHVEHNTVTGIWSYGAQQVVEQVFEGTVDPGSDHSWNSCYTNIKGEVIDTGEWYTKECWSEQYWDYETTTHTVDGVSVAQTFLNSQDGWLLKIGVTFASAGADGLITAILCETANGVPNLDRALGKTTLAAGDIKTDGSESFFVFEQPVFLSSGKRLALVLITGGQHTVNLVDGTSYTNGILLYSQDGAYYAADTSKDLMMSLVFAQFASTRVIVDLTPIDLVGGIAGFDILAPMTITDTADCQFEFQMSGSSEWLPFSNTNAARLLGLPALCKLRSVMTGTQDVMPGLGLTGSRIRATRPDTAFKHISTARNLAAASSNIQVTLLLTGWNAAKHTCEVVLLSGGNTYTGTVQDETEADGSVRRVVTITPPAISSYKIQIVGTTTTNLDCYVVAQRMDVAM